MPSEGFWNGVAVTLVVVTLIWFTMSIAAKGRAYTYDYPSMKQRCVLVGPSDTLGSKYIDRCYAIEPTVTP